MRNLFLTTAVVLFTAFQSVAQNPKFGHVNYIAVIDSLPSKLAADKEMQNFMAEGQKTVTGMEAELQTALDAYVAEKPNLSAVMQEVREKQIQEQNQILEMKRQSLQQDLEVLNGRYYDPIEKRLKDAIAIVAKKNNLTYVLNEETLLYVEGGMDITKEVKAEMIRLEAAASTLGN